MPLYRRRSPQGVIQRIFIPGIGVQGSSYCAVEGLSSPQANVHMGIENLTGLLTDRILPNEFGAAVLRDMVPPIEAVLSVQDSVALALESLGGGGVASYAFGQIENVAIFGRDLSGILESVLSQSGDRASQMESLVYLPRSDAVAAVESLLSVVADKTSLIENTGVIVVIANVMAAIENVISFTSTSSAIWENVLAVQRDTFGQIEVGGAATLVANINIVVESLAAAQLSIPGIIEDLAMLHADSPASVEYQGAAQLTATTLGQLENIALFSTALITSLENVVSISLAIGVPAESVASVLQNVAVRLESIGSVVVQADTQAAMESAAVLSGALGVPIESNFVARADVLAAQLEAGIAVRQDVVAFFEDLATALRDTQSELENVATTLLATNTLIPIEVSGQSFTADFASMLTEYGQQIRGDSLARIEAQARISSPVDPSTPSPIESGPFVMLDTTHTSVSIGRVRTVAVRDKALETAAQPFDPLAANTLDTFAIDFTADVGSASILSTNWTVSFDPGSAGADDDTPQARVIKSWAPTQLFVRNPLDGLVMTWTGAYSAAAIGTCPLTAVGGTYSLTATVHLSDTRILQDSVAFLCIANPQQVQ